MRILHISTAHDTSDDRIMMRQSKSLAMHGFQIFLVAQIDIFHRLINDTPNLKIINLPKWHSRIDRLIRGNIFVIWHILRINPKIIHFHDPELIPIALLFRLVRKKVIIDLHEDITKQLIEKIYLPRSLIKILLISMPIFMRISTNLMSGVVVATESIGSKYSEDKVTLVRNLPRISEFNSPKNLSPQPTLVYIGLINQDRGLNKMLKIAELIPDIRLILAGPISEQDLNSLKSNRLYGTKVEYLGVINRSSVIKLLSTAWLGLCIFEPLPNHVEARPGKIYEYMASSTPIVISNFKDWIQFIEVSGAGFSIDGQDIFAASVKIQNFINNISTIKNAGAIGRNLVIEKYSWEEEEKRLIGLYHKIL
jgi:glycosyltransferase involved in cell wall biosynthesis